MSEPLWNLSPADERVQSPKSFVKAKMFVIGALATVIVTMIWWLSRPRQIYCPISMRSQCKNNMKQIGLGLHLYHERYGSFPPAYVTDANGRPAHSWRVLILPFMELEPLYREYRFDEPWNGPHNSKLADLILDVYQCPRFVDDYHKQKLETARTKRMTNYVVISAPHAIFNGNQSTKMSDVTDGASTTMMVAETRKHSVHWMQPEDVSPDEILTELQTATLSEQRTGGKCSGIHGLNILFADGTVRFLSPQTDPAVFRGYITRDGQDDVDVTVLHVATYRFFFLSHERNDPPSIHVERKLYSDPWTARFWLEPVALATNSGFEPYELKNLETTIGDHQTEFLESWRERFGNPK